MLRASHEGSQKVVVRTVITVRFVPGAAIAKSILYCAGQIIFKESGHHLTGTDTIYFVTAVATYAQLNLFIYFLL